MKCHCGFENPANSRFCVACGAALNLAVENIPAAPVLPAAAMAKGGGKTVIAAAAIVVLSAAGYGVTQWWNNRPDGWYRKDNSGLFRIRESGKFGYMDKSGKTLIGPQYDDAGDFSEGLAVIHIGGKAGYIGRDGKIEITPQFDDAEEFVRGRARVKLCCGPMGRASGRDRFGYIDTHGKKIGSVELLSNEPFWGSLAAIQTSSGFGFIDSDGKLAIPTTFSGVSYLGFAGGRAPVRSGQKWGFIDKSGQWVIEPQFDNALNYAEGLAPVAVGGKWGYIDSAGKFVINPQFDSAQFFDHGFAAVLLFNRGGWSLIDTSGAPVADLRLTSVRTPNEGLRGVTTDDGYGFLEGKTFVIKPRFATGGDFAGGLALVVVRGEEFYINRSGVFIGKQPAANPAQSAAAGSPSTPVPSDSGSSALTRDWSGEFDCRGRPHTITMAFMEESGEIHAHVFVAGIGGALYLVTWDPATSTMHAVPLHEMEHIVDTTWLNIDGHYKADVITGSVAGCGSLRMTRNAAQRNGQSTTGPSFNCQAARSAIERAICADPGLAAEEMKMATAYRETLASLPPGIKQTVFQRSHAQWFRDYVQSCTVARDGGALQECIMSKLSEHTSGLRAWNR